MELTGSVIFGATEDCSGEVAPVSDDRMTDNKYGCCTESLGFESSDQMEGEEDMEDTTTTTTTTMTIISMSRGSVQERASRRSSFELKKLFPPPLSSLNRNGDPVFLLKPVRKDGRLKLHKVWINRPEILRAERRENRLRLFVVSSDTEIDQRSSKEEEDEEEEIVSSGEEEGRVAEEEITRWKLPLCSNREGFQRCKRNHHHQIPLWSHQCLATN